MRLTGTITKHVADDSHLPDAVQQARERLRQRLSGVDISGRRIHDPWKMLNVQQSNEEFETCNVHHLNEEKTLSCLFGFGFDASMKASSEWNVLCFALKVGL